LTWVPQSGYARKRTPDSVFRGSSPGELRETIINDAEEHVTEAALQETNVKLVPSGALLLAM
jgi:hypothetical protein